MTNTQTQPTNERPSDPNDTLNTLREMSEQGTKEWWCRLVKRGHFNQCSKWTWHYEHPWNKEIVRLDDQHALDLVEKSCERWLEKQQYGQFRRDGLGESAEYSLRGIEFADLPEAIEYAMGQETTHNKKGRTHEDRTYHAL